MHLRVAHWLGLPVLAGLIACHPNKTNSDTEAFTNRPQNYDRFIAIVKLNAPALLTKKRILDGKPVVDASLAAKVDAEQKAFLVKLQAIAPEAKILYTYRMVLNGFAIAAPKKYEAQFRAISGTSYVEDEQSFAQASFTQGLPAANADLEVNNSVTFIGAKEFRDALGITGTGVKVGVIDTGIDYTHKMFGGEGTVAAYQSVDPAVLPEHAFERNRVKGGIDLVGTKYDSASPNFDLHIPTPDNNPLDEYGHGSHVAGTIAGTGDGQKTYTGVAPGADLYAIKVFGKVGSTGDAVIIGALEYAADPNKDGRLDDAMDVVNLSLGSDYGTPHLLYSEAMNNLILGGTFVVASAGNSGPVPYIVGSPSTTPRAISVAASVDGSEHNWQFIASEFQFADGHKVTAEAFEASFALPIASAQGIEGELVPVGFADTDFDATTAAKLVGKVAFIDRGKVPFCDKASRAQKVGAVGFVVADTAPGALTTMGGDCKITIPGIRVSKELGDAVRQSKDPVHLAFNNGAHINKPELIDTLTGFSSRGPRSYDGLLKPEIAAPGQNIISAAMGRGDEGESLNGTSMAAPHITGVVALLKAAHKSWDVETIKGALMGTALRMKDVNGEVYPTAYQGAGRVQVSKAGRATVVANPAALSLGLFGVPGVKVLDRVVKVVNQTHQDVSYAVSAENQIGLRLDVPAQITIPANGSAWLKVRSFVDLTFTASEREAQVVLKDANGETVRIPVFALTENRSELTLENSSIQNGELTMNVENHGTAAGNASLFRLLSRDARKSGTNANIFRNNICDLAAVGYRVRTETDGKGVTKSYLEVAAKTFDAITNWHLCELSVQFDTNKDGKPDFELIGAPLSRINNNAAQAVDLQSILTDANQMTAIRKAYEAAWPASTTADYSPAALDVQPIVAPAFSSTVVLKVDLAQLGITDATAAADLSVKVALQVATEAATPEQDDFLADQDSKWGTISLPAGLDGVPASLTVAPGETATIKAKLAKPEPLMLLFPQNALDNERPGSDRQSVIID